MKCPRCDSPIAIGFYPCVSCLQDRVSTEPIPCKYFVAIASVVLWALGLQNSIEGLGVFFQGIFVAILGGLIFGSIAWLFYGIFRPGHQS